MIRSDGNTSIDCVSLAVAAERLPASAQPCPGSAVPDGTVVCSWCVSKENPFSYPSPSSTVPAQRGPGWSPRAPRAPRELPAFGLETPS